MLSDSRIQPLVRLLYLAGALVLASQILEIWSFVISAPADPELSQWRLRLFGAVSGRIPIMVLGDALLFAGMIRLENRAAIRRMGWVHLMIAPALGAGFVIMLRDVMALRNRVAGNSVEVGGVRVGTTLALATLLALLTGWFAIQGSRRARWGSRKRPATPLFTDTEETPTPDRAGGTGPS